MHVKNDSYWNLINKIVDLRNQILESEEDLKNCTNPDDYEMGERYVQEGYTLEHEVFLMLYDMGFTKDEIEFDVAHA